MALAKCLHSRPPPFKRAQHFLLTGAFRKRCHSGRSVMRRLPQSLLRVGGRDNQTSAALEL